MSGNLRLLKNSRENMRLRYKNTGTETSSYRWNIHALAEVLTGDDTVCITDLDVWIDGAWKDMRAAFRDKDIISNNYNDRFGIPESEEAKRRGWND